MGLLKIFFVAILLFLTFGEIIRFELGNNVALKPLDIGVLILVAVWFIGHLLKGKKFRKTNLLMPIAIFSGVGFVSLFLNSRFLNQNEFMTSFLYLWRWISYAGVYFAVSEFDTTFKRKIPIFMTFAGLAIILIGYVQYFFYPNLRNLYYLGWDEHLYRMFSTFLDPNFAGAFFVLYFLLLVGFYDRKVRVLIVLGLLTLVAVYLTYSRSALLMLFAGSFTLLSIKRKLPWMLVLLGISMLVFIVFSRNFSIENVNLLRTASGEARLDSAKSAMIIIKGNPILGVGFNAYRFALIRYGFRERTQAIISHADASTDNSFLFVLATTGIIGLLAYLWIWFRVIRKALIFCHKTSSSLPAIVLASSIGLFVDSLFINSLFFSSLMLWLWILIGIMEST